MTNILNIGIGSAPNDTTGDPLRTAMTKIMTAVNGLGSYFVGPTPPAAPMTPEAWFDTSAAPWTLRFWDGAQWVAAGTLNTSTHIFIPQGGGTFTGDATGTIPNIVLLTSTNPNPGTWGSATAIPVLTTNTKGLVTGASTATVVAQAGTLTGSVLAGNVNGSSLTTLATVTTGTWHGSPVGAQWGGTGLATLAAHGVLIGEGTANVAVTATGTTGQVLTSNGAAADPTFQTLPLPQVTIINVPGGSTGTYTTPIVNGVRAQFLEVEFNAAGGGGGGSSTNANNGANGSSGGLSSFGTALFSATGGSGGAKSSNAAIAMGGTGGIGSGGTENLSGGNGSDIPIFIAAGFAGVPPIGGAGIKWAVPGAGKVGVAGLPGGQGGGGGGNYATGQFASASGGAGGYCHGFVTAPAASYPYVQGAGGAGGAAGTSGFAGGAGGDGYIVIIARWQ